MADSARVNGLNLLAIPSSWAIVMPAALPGCNFPVHRTRPNGVTASSVRIEYFQSCPELAAGEAQGSGPFDLQAGSTDRTHGTINARNPHV